MVRGAGPGAERAPGGALRGWDVIAVGDAFGETFFYYTARSPATGRFQRNVIFFKQVVVYGLPILLASGYYLDEWGAKSPCRVN